METFEPRLAETEEERTYGERKWTASRVPYPLRWKDEPLSSYSCCLGSLPRQESSKCKMCWWWTMLQLDASLRVASPTSIEHSWMFCRSTVKQHSQQRAQKMCTRPKLRPPGRERTELRDHLEDGSSVPTFSRKKQSMSGLGATPLQRSCAQNTGQRASNIGSEFRNRSICWKRRSSSVLCDIWWTQECDLEECVAARWRRDVPAATHSTTSGNSCANCLRHGQIRQTRPHAVGSSSLGRRRLLCCRAPRPLHISEIPSPAFLGWGLGSPSSPILWTRRSHDFRAESALDVVCSSQSGGGEGVACTLWQRLR